MRHEVVVVGAGPYGLAAGAHLTFAGVEAHVFGDPMAFWRRQMPQGMLLRSAWYACNISDPRGDFALNRYQAVQPNEVPAPVPLNDFIAYADWFQRNLVPGIDTRNVERVELSDKYFRVHLESGNVVTGEHVVIAAGISRFAYRPPLYQNLAAVNRASHTSDHSDLSRFSGQSIAVIGGGQSALESAALLREAGAEVEIIMRAGQVRFLSSEGRVRKKLTPLQRLSRSQTDVGPPWLTHLMSRPELLRCLPRRLQARLAYRSIRPAGAGWLRPRLKEVSITCGRNVLSAIPCQGRAALTLDNSSKRIVDHVLLATGYKVNVAAYPFLAPELIRSLRLFEGYPELTSGFESSVPGLHFLGAPAAWSFGPLARFVSGTSYSARALTRCIIRNRSMVSGGRKLCLNRPATPNRLAS